MEKIASFTINHDTLTEGIYISRIDGDITTYDLRFIRPNTPPFLEQKALHTIEHLFATFLRNSKFSENIIYFGPMGCRTGFYLLVRNLSEENTVALLKEVLDLSIDFEGEIPGSSKIECGNYKEHDLDGAKEALRKYREAVKDWTSKDLQYK